MIENTQQAKSEQSGDDRRDDAHPQDPVPHKGVDIGEEAGATCEPVAESEQGGG